MSVNQVMSVNQAMSGSSLEGEVCFEALIELLNKVALF